MGEESDVSDEVLWCQVVNGDGGAFGVLFDRHHDRVWRHALRVLRLPHVAEDVTAVVFYEAWRRRVDVRMVNDSILPWLLVTTNNTWSSCPPSPARATPSDTDPGKQRTAAASEAVRPGIHRPRWSFPHRPAPAQPGGSCSRQGQQPLGRWLWG